MKKNKNDINILFINDFFYKIKKHKNQCNIKYKLKNKKKYYCNNKKNKINNYLSYLINYNQILFIYIKNNNSKFINLKLNYLYKKESINYNINFLNIIIFVGKKTKLIIKEYYNKNINKKIYIINFKIIIRKYCNVIYLKYKNKLLNYINNIIIYQNYNSIFNLYHINLYDNFVVNYINIYNISNYCINKLYGIIITNKLQINYNYILIKNYYNNCLNKQYYIGIYDGNTINILKGVIDVNYNTKNNISYQNYKNFILSNKVIVDFKPYLNIKSNKIKCSHGVTIGKIDQNLIYYLQTRGLTSYKSKIIFFLSILYKNLIKKKIIFNNIKNNIKKKLKLILIK